jgi:DNA-binding LytR/AlgR family response regulator
MLVWDSPRQATVVEPMDVYWLEAEGRTTWLRLRGRGRLHDHRSLAEVVEALEPFGFLRIHRNHAVNLRRLAEVRRRSSGMDWEVKLEPPVNRVLPVARGREEDLVAALGG